MGHNYSSSEEVPVGCPDCYNFVRKNDPFEKEANRKLSKLVHEFDPLVVISEIQKKFPKLGNSLHKFYLWWKWG